jgi:SAM-dependent methyltransferase
VLTVNLRRLGLRPGERLLDAGCGGGRHCFGALALGASAIGLDLDLGELRKARAGIAERGAAPGFGGVLQGDVFRLPFPDAHFDRVICAEVMEHVHDYESALGELVRVLKPGGTVGITIPTASSEWFYFGLSREYFESPGGHIRIFEPRQLAAAMSRRGLTVNGVGFAHALHTPYWMLRSMLGLNRENLKPVRAYKNFLMRASVSAGWERIERWLNWVCPKSLVLYASRTATGLPR